MLHIEVTNVGHGRQGHILASCRVELRSEDGKDKISVLDARVLRNKKNGCLFVGFPNQSMKDRLGTSKFVPIVEVSPELHRRISEYVLLAFNGPAGAEQRLNAIEGDRKSFPAVISNGR